MYTLLVTDNNELISTVQDNIIEGSSLVDKIHILSAKNYEKIDLSECTAYLEYVLPSAKIANQVELEKNVNFYVDSLGEEYLEYFVNIDSNLTSESGNVAVRVTFVKKSGQNTIIRRTEEGNIYITPSTTYLSSTIPTPSSSALEIETDDINWDNLEDNSTDSSTSGSIVDANGNVYEFETENVDWDSLNDDTTDDDSETITDDVFETDNIKWDSVLNNGGDN